MTEAWPTGIIDELAFQIMILKTALTFWGRPWDAPLSFSSSWDQTFPHPISEKERTLVSEWQSYPIEEREASLERTLNHFVGGTLQSVVEEARKRKMVFKRNAKW